MATIQRQNALVWVLWCTLIALGCCRSLKDLKQLLTKSQTTARVTRQDDTIHARNSSEPSIERVLYYGHLTIGAKKLNRIDEGKPIARDTELFGGPFDDNDYQSDSYAMVKESERGVEGVFSQGNKRTPAVDRLLGMKPKVECVEDSMTLNLHGAASSQFPFLVDRGNAHPLSLSKMPSVCGYSVRKSWKDLVFSTPYDGCFVAEEGSNYVLPLFIYGLPVRMTCPSIAPKPPSASCHVSGMTVKIESSYSVKDVHVKVNSKWESLMKISSQCGFSVVEHPEGVIISAPYLPCIQEQDGMFTFEVAAGGDFKISCPSQPSTMHAMATACPESSSTACPTTALAGDLKPAPVEDPQHPQRPVPQSTQAPLYPVYPKKPAPVEDPSKSMPISTPEPVQSPEPFPFYPFHPGFYMPGPQPDVAAARTEPEHSVEPQIPQRPVPQSTQAPLYPVYPKKPAPVEDPSKSIPLYTPKPVQSPEQLPFYPYHPGFYMPGPQPDVAAASPEPEHSVEPQIPQRPVPQSTQAPLYPVYPKKPAPVEDPSKSIPLYTPKPVQSPDQFPFYPFHPGFYMPGPQPDVAAASPEPEHSVEPQIPQRPVPQSTQAPLYPVYPKKPAPVEDPSKSMPLSTPEPVQSPKQLPFYPYHPGFYMPGPQPDVAAASPEPEHSVEPQIPQRPVPQSTQAPLYPVYPKKPAPVEDPSKSIPLYTPKPVQSPDQFPFYPYHPGFYMPGPQPDVAAASPEPENSVEPQIPQRPVPQSTQAPLYPVYPKKPAPVEDPSKGRPLSTPEAVQSPDQFPFYPYHPGFYMPGPQPDVAAASPEPEHSVEPQIPQRPVPQSTQAPLYPVYPKKPAPVEDPSKGRPLSTPEAVQSPDQFPFYPYHPGFYMPGPQPDVAAASPEPEHSVEPQIPQRPVPQSTQAPLYPVYPKKPAPVEDPSKGRPLSTPEAVQSPAPPTTPQGPAYPLPYYASWPHSSFPIEPKPPTKNTKYSEAPLSHTPGSHPVEVPEPPNRVFHRPTDCLTVCTVAHSNCCPLALSFHQHHHHHNHFGPALGQVVQPAPATSGKEPSFIQQHFSHSLTNSVNKQLLYPFLNATHKPTPPTPSLQRVSYQEQDAKRMLTSQPDPTVKPISPSTNHIFPPSRSSYMYIPVNGQHFQNPPNGVQLTQQSAPKSPSIQPVKDPRPHQWFQYPYSLPNPKSTSSSGPHIPTNNTESTTVKTLGLPSVQVAKYPILKPQSPVKDPAPYPWFQTPYFVPYPPPTSKPHGLPETLTSLPHPSITSAFNTEAPSSQFHKGLISTPPSFKPTQKTVPYPWSQHLSELFRSFSSDSPRVHSTQSKPSTSELTQREPLGVSQTQYWHQTVPGKGDVGDKYSKVPFDPESSKPHPRSVGPSQKKTSPQHSSSGTNDNYFVPLGSSQFKDYWKPVRLHHKH